MKRSVSPDGYDITLLHLRLRMNVFLPPKHGSTSENRGDKWHNHEGVTIYSIGISGKYEEMTDQGRRIWRAPWFRKIPDWFEHKVSVVGDKCRTLNLLVYH